jgi:hypothetical protein
MFALAIAQAHWFRLAKTIRDARAELLRAHLRRAKDRLPSVRGNSTQGPQIDPLHAGRSS